MNQPDKNENISLDDISFDDMLSGGVEAEPEMEVPEIEEEATINDELDADADNLKVEDEEEDIVEEEGKEPEEKEEEEDKEDSEKGASKLLFLKFYLN